MNGYNILIVEDEVMIAGMLARYVESHAHKVCGIAISYEQAVKLVMQEQPQIVLLDIRLSGLKTGIDIARWLRGNHPGIPFIFLTSQFDLAYMEEVKETFPAGYLAKPISKNSLLATIEITMHEEQLSNPQLIINTGGRNVSLNRKDILFIRAEHVYLNVYVKNNPAPYLIRQSLGQFQENLPADQFVKTHRSYVVNVKQISGWNKNELFIGEHIVLVARAFQQELKLLLPES